MLQTEHSERHASWFAIKAAHCERLRTCAQWRSKADSVDLPDKAQRWEKQANAITDANGIVSCSHYMETAETYLEYAEA